MPARSKIDTLPDDVRQALEQRLIAAGFGGYEDLATWLAEQGFEISRSAIHRWGERFEERVRIVKIATEQAKALVQSAPDAGGAMNDALVRLAQEKVFQILMECDVDPDKIDFTKLLRGIAELTRGSVAQKKWEAEAAERAREQQLAEQRDRLASVAKTRGMSADVVEQIRREILGIAS